MKQSFTTVLALGLALTAGSASAQLVQLINNGGFETGTFAGWTVTDELGGSGSWFIDNADGLTPFSSQLTVGPAAGNFYAVSDQTGGGTHILEQSFTVPLGTISLSLTFDMFINDWDSGPVVNPAGLTYLAGANQHARVDIMSPVAGPFSTAPVDIVVALVPPTVDGGADPHPYTAYAFNLTGILVPGATYKLRFAEVDNQFFFNQGVDNVSLVAVVPEPTTLALVLLGCAGLAAPRRNART